MKHLALFLRGPMQSWGVSGKFGERPTMSFPSKSGVLGMLAAAVGIDRENIAWLQGAAELKFAVRTYKTGTRLSDYHTVGGGFDSGSKSVRERRSIPAKAEDGKPGKTALTRREYLQDTVFGVVLSGDDALIQQMADGLRNPVWGIWLGRKSCIPTEPVFAGLAETEEEAWGILAMRAEFARCKLGETVLAMTECEPSVADDLLPDLPVSFGKRQFGARAVAYSTVSPKD